MDDGSERDEEPTGEELARALREEIAHRDALIREAADALVKDAAEVVRVVAELERRDAVIKADLQQALRFQRAMLPPMPVRRDLALETLYLPADVISGDVYDVAVLGDDFIRIFVADATGHGVAAGLATMFIKSEYESHKREAVRPADLLRAMNDQLATRYHNLDLRFTAICLDVRPRARRVVYASAAHPGPIHAAADGTTTVLPSGGPFVGLLAEIDFPTHEIGVAPEDLFLVHTDGLLDAASRDGTMFGEERAKAIVARARAAKALPCGEIVRTLSELVGEGRSLPDDVAVVAFSIGA